VTRREARGELHAGALATRRLRLYRPSHPSSRDVRGEATPVQAEALLHLGTGSGTRPTAACGVGGGDLNPHSPLRALAPEAIHTSNRTRCAVSHLAPALRFRASRASHGGADRPSRGEGRNEPGDQRTAAHQPTQRGVAPTKGLHKLGISSANSFTGRYPTPHERLGAPNHSPLCVLPTSGLMAKPPVAALAVGRGDVQRAGGPVPQTSAPTRDFHGRDTPREVRSSQPSHWCIPRFGRGGNHAPGHPRRRKRSGNR
jgi:hypothetical protein